MSASREKNIRRQQREEGTEKRQVRSKNKARNAKTRKTVTSIVAVVAVLLICFLILVNSTLLYTKFPAMKVGDWKFSKSELDYEKYLAYQTTYQNLYNTYGEYTSYILDTSRPLSEQQYSDTQTWEDYINESAVDNLVQIAALWDKGHAEGHPESPDAAAAVDNAISSLRAAATSAGFTSFNSFLNLNIGKGVTEKTIKSILPKVYYAADYSQKLVDDWKEGFTGEELDEYYDTVSEQYDILTYAGYSTTAYVEETEEGEDTEALTEAAMEEAETRAEAVAAAEDEDDFFFKVQEIATEAEQLSYQQKANMISKTTPASLTNEEWRAWFTDAGRKYGDTIVFQTDSGYVTLMFISLDHNDYDMANYHVIRVDAEIDEETGEITDELIQAKDELADEILALFEADPTAENFETLAIQYSKESAAGLGGGYEQMSKNDYSAAIVTEYVFAAGRKAGDYAVLREGSSSYLVYVDSFGEQYNHYIASTLLGDEKYGQLIDELTEQYPVSTTFAYKLGD